MLLPAPAKTARGGCGAQQVDCGTSTPTDLTTQLKRCATKVLAVADLGSSRVWLWHVAYDEFEEACVRVRFAREFMLWQKSEQELRGCADRATGRDVAAEHVAVCVGHGHMQMRAVQRHGAGQRQNLKVAAQFGGGW